MTLVYSLMKKGSMGWQQSEEKGIIILELTGSIRFIRTQLWAFCSILKATPWSEKATGAQTFLSMSLQNVGGRGLGVHKSGPPMRIGHLWPVFQKLLLRLTLASLGHYDLGWPYIFIVQTEALSKVPCATLLIIVSAYQTEKDTIAGKPETVVNITPRKGEYIGFELSALLPQINHVLYE